VGGREIRWSMKREDFKLSRKGFLLLELNGMDILLTAEKRESNQIEEGFPHFKEKKSQQENPI